MPFRRPTPLRTFGLLAGPCVAIAVGMIVVAWGQPAAMAWTLGITVWCACWWTTEAVPMPITSLLPAILFPILGILTPRQVLSSYANEIIFLLLGGFMLSRAMERSGAHRRLAIFMIRATGGTSLRRIVWGFMGASALLSMWISNSATTVMLVPVALAVADHVEDRKFLVKLLLGVAYSASIGGIGTPIGTPPNLICIQNYQLATGHEMTFLEWMRTAVPVVLLMVPVAGLWLTRGGFGRQPIRLPEVGHWQAGEIRVLSVFAITAMLWVTRAEPLGGWSQWLNVPWAGDATVALTAAAVLLLLPDGTGERLLPLSAAVRIPWGVLILFGGGITIAAAFQASGLSAWLGQSLTLVAVLPMMITMALVCTVVTFLTEVTSNTATATILMPILAAAAVASDLDPRLLMIPATMSVSFAFMLPVATAPNIIVFGSGQMRFGEMAREGLMLNVIGIVIVTGVCYGLLVS